MVTGSTPGWEVLMMLSWRQGYLRVQINVVCPLQIGFSTADVVASKECTESRIKCVEVFCHFDNVTLFSQLLRFPARRIDCVCFVSGIDCTQCLVVGGGRACACTRVETSGSVCTLCIEKRAVCCMTGMWKILQDNI